MAVKINVQSDIDKMLRSLGQKERQRVEVAAQRAILQTARAVKAAADEGMRKSFDRPTRWTLSALSVTVGQRGGMHKGKDVAKAGGAIQVAVEVKDGYWHGRRDSYLDTQAQGGGRKQKAFERALSSMGNAFMPAGWYAVPGQKAKLDAHGNMSVGEIKQIMSWFRAAEPYSGSTQNMTQEGRDRRRKGTRTRRGFEYFAIGTNNTRGKLRPGIYRRTFFAWGSAIEPVLIFVQKVQYRPLWDFYGMSEKVIADTFPTAFSQALKHGNR